MRAFEAFQPAGPAVTAVAAVTAVTAATAVAESGYPPYTPGPGIRVLKSDGLQTGRASRWAGRSRERCSRVAERARVIELHKGCQSHGKTPSAISWARCRMRYMRLMPSTTIVARPTAVRPTRIGRAHRKGRP